MNELHERIRQAREARGLSQQEVADAVGISQPAVRKIESGETRKSRYLPEIMRYLRIAPDQVEELAQKAFPIARSDLVGAKDFPVYGAAEGGGGHLVMTSDPVDYMRRPAPLELVRDGYGVIITGTSMIPAFWPGDVALVHPHLPPVANSHVILYSSEEPGWLKVTVKYLIRETSTHWHLKQWNPPDGSSAEFKLPKEEWPRAHSVVGSYHRR
jgi:transcriptional regulator with XRE-family HTH domain